ncbi:MAG TPA: Maf family protein [Kofleriaceae bacterium]|nr:Maf family protein [Kofleriaceae bacterium]
MSRPLILASASPRRREMLERIGLAIEVRPADLDETAAPGEPPGPYVARIARAKALAVARAADPRDRWVLAADTTVTIDGLILGKAESPAEAAAMLDRLAGRTHDVLTAFAIVGPGVGPGAADAVRHEAVVRTEVEMVAFDAATRDDYVASGEWRGKAGAYAVQGIAASLVHAIRGSITNVIGLPLAEVVAALREVGAARPRFADGRPV